MNEKRFSQYHEENSRKIMDILSKNIKPSNEQITKFLSKKIIEVEDVYILLQAEGNKEFEKIIFEKSNTKRQEKWKNRLFLVPPLYITSRCINNCAYCPWRRDNKVQRTSLSIKEFEREVDFLIKEGYRIIELVGASDPLLKGKDIAGFIKITKDKLKKVGGGEVGLNFESANFEDYRLFKEAGLDFMVLWQETYHKNTYEKLHPSKTKKSVIDYRLDAFDRAIKAGIKKVGLAFLGRLYDYKYELLFLFLHAEYLKKTYGINPFIIGSPRWIYSKGQCLTKAPSEYTDDQWKLVASIIKLIFPSSLPWFSTREKFKLSKIVLSGGGMLFTLDCSTSVGGYASKKTFSQFPVYSMNLRQGIRWLRDLGYNPELRLPK